MNIGKSNRHSIGKSELTSVLSQYEGMPDSLFIIGKLPADRPPVVAIIGSRRPTAYGKEVTHRLAYDLAKQGVIIVSGLAYGIDAIAHEAALEAGGTTIAVLANGLHRIYPATHEGLAKRIIAQGGALISEQPDGTDARKYHFLARNRIVSGIADAVIVTEATDRSGTFSTVTHALTQNKEVFAVPGPITSLLSAGPNRLLQEGARVALSADDIMHVIAPHTPTARQLTLTLGDNEQEVLIIDAMRNGDNDIELLAQKLSMDTAQLLQTITHMELKGTLRTTAGKLFLTGA